MATFRGFSGKESIQYAAKESKILGKDHWRVLESFRYYIGDKYSESWIFVPRGYLTDGASVPRIFWGLIPPWGEYGQAAIVHDYLCEFLSITQNGQPVSITRERADEIFLEAMEVLGVGRLLRESMHLAVSVYREVSGVDEATSNPLIRQLEAAWEKEHGSNGSTCGANPGHPSYPGSGTRG